MLVDLSHNARVKAATPCQPSAIEQREVVAHYAPPRQTADEAGRGGAGDRADEESDDDELTLKQMLAKEALQCEVESTLPPQSPPQQQPRPHSPSQPTGLKDDELAASTKAATAAAASAAALETSGAALSETLAALERERALAYASGQTRHRPRPGVCLTPADLGRVGLGVVVRYERGDGAALRDGDDDADDAASSWEPGRVLGRGDVAGTVRVTMLDLDERGDAMGAKEGDEEDDALDIDVANVRVDANAPPPPPPPPPPAAAAAAAVTDTKRRTLPGVAVAQVRSTVPTVLPTPAMTAAAPAVSAVATSTAAMTLAPTLGKRKKIHQIIGARHGVPPSAPLPRPSVPTPTLTPTTPTRRQRWRLLRCRRWQHRRQRRRRLRLPRCRRWRH